MTAAPAMRLSVFLALLVASVAGAAAAAEDGAFLFDALRERPYRAAWDRLMKEVQPTPDWLMQFNRNFEVMFVADATHAYGALGGRSDSPAFYGAPPPDVQDALARGFQG